MVNTDEQIRAAERQVGAIVAKTLENLESIEGLRSLHPLEFDAVRRAVMKALWSTYTVGLKFGERLNEKVHGA